MKTPALVFRESGEHIAQAHTIDVSKGGARLKLDRSIDLPDRFLISLSERGDVQRLCRLVWRAAGEIGVSFIEPVRPRAVATMARKL